MDNVNSIVRDHCSVDECVKDVKAKGFCQMHYIRWKKSGSTDKPPSHNKKKQILDKKLAAKLGVTNIDKMNAVCRFEHKGAPPKYNTPQEMIPKIEAFFADLDDPKRKDPYMPTGLCLALDISRDAMADYSTKPGFSTILQKARLMIEHDLNRMGIRGKINPVSWIFYMKNAFHYSDKQEIDNRVTVDLAADLREALKGVKGPELKVIPNSNDGNELE